MVIPVEKNMIPYQDILHTLINTGIQTVMGPDLERMIISADETVV